MLRPLGQGHYELIVPRFFGLRAGWPVRETESYSIYEVSRFTHLLDPLPAWLCQERGNMSADHRLEMSPVHRNECPLNAARSPYSAASSFRCSASFEARPNSPARRFSFSR